MRKRILLMIKGLGRGGAEQLLVNAAPYLDTENFDYRVGYILPWKDALVRPLEERGLRSECLAGAHRTGWIARLGRLVVDERIDIPNITYGSRTLAQRTGATFSRTSATTTCSLFQIMYGNPSNFRVCSEGSLDRRSRPSIMVRTRGPPYM